MLRHSILRRVDNPNDIMIDLDFASKEEAEGLLAAMRQVWGHVQGTLIFGLRAQIVETVETKAY